MWCKSGKCNWIRIKVFEDDLPLTDVGVWGKCDDSGSCFYSTTFIAASKPLRVGPFIFILVLLVINMLSKTMIYHLQGPTYITSPVQEILWIWGGRVIWIKAKALQWSLYFLKQSTRKISFNQSIFYWQCVTDKKT